MARCIIRFSLEGDNGTDTTRIRNELERQGFQKIGTAVYEGDFPGEADRAVVTKLQTVLSELQKLVVATGIDHLWVYLDEPEVPFKM